MWLHCAKDKKRILVTHEVENYLAFKKKKKEQENYQAFAERNDSS